MKAFDRKFGPSFVAELPTTPAVYLFRDDPGRVIYVGKAKNIRRRLSSYRNATRRKVHRKMRAIVRAAASVEIRLMPTETGALELENELIRTLRPKLNVEGKYDFLYPAIGLARTSRHTLLCFTTDCRAYESFGLRWFGCFRSRARAKEAFEALTTLLALLGHLEKSSALGERPRLRGSQLRGFRQLSAGVVSGLDGYLAGTDPRGLRVLAIELLDKPRARRDATEVQEHLTTLADFYQSDLAPLHRALRSAGRSGNFVSQDERDTLFIRQRAG